MQLCIHAKITFAAVGLALGYTTYAVYQKLARRGAAKG